MWRPQVNQTSFVVCSRQYIWSEGRGGRGKGKEGRVSELGARESGREDDKFLLVTSGLGSSLRAV